jgi:hypothetical protein
LPKEKFQEIYEIHQQMNSFPEGYAKEDYDWFFHYQQFTTAGSFFIFLGKWWVSLQYK